MAETEPLSFFVKLDGPSGPMCPPYNNQFQHKVQWQNFVTQALQGYLMILSSNVPERGTALECT